MGKACSICGSINRPQAKFCDECGNQLTTDRPHHHKTFQVRSDLAEHILSNSDQIQDELKDVTVVFADVSNSTSLVEELSPEAARKLLEPTLQLLIEAVHTNGGVVARLQGDGIMALFGAPVAMEDHALRACRAAIHMQRTIADVKKQGIRVHIGLNSGSVLVRLIQTKEFREYDLAGLTVHLAARMEEMAQAGEIRMTGDTAARVEGYARLTPIESVRVRGVKKDVDSYILESLSELRTRWEAQRARGLSSFLGRGAEQAKLEKALRYARSGQGKLVAVEGEAGIGKSRLIHEFENSTEAVGIKKIYAAAGSDGSQMSYLAIQSLLKSCLGDDSSGLDVRTTAKEQLLSEPGDYLALPATALKSVLNLSFNDEHWENLDPLERRRAILDAACAVVTNAAEEQPLIIIIEDLHWIDQESQDVLQALSAMLSEHKILMVVSYRPEYELDWHDGFERVTLTPLPFEPAGVLLDEIMGDGPSLVKLKKMLVERAGGIPLFLEELVRAVDRSGAVQGLPGDYHLAEQLSDIELPGTVTAIISARIDGLAPLSKKLLSLSAVIGYASAPLLTMASGMNSHAIDRSLLLLLDTELLRPSRSGGSIIFKHDIIREVAYSLILEDDRREMHALIADCIEQSTKERIDENIDQLALHFLRGERWEKAARYHFKACVRGLARSANAQVVSLSDSGIFALSNLPASEEWTKRAVDFKLIANNALISDGNLDAILTNLDEASVLSSKINDQRRTASVKTHLAIGCWLQGEHQTGMAAASEALQIAKEISHPGLQIGSSAALAMSLHAVGQYEKSNRLNKRLAGHLNGDARFIREGWAVYPFVLISTFLASAQIEQGDFKNARGVLDEAVKFAEEVCHPYSQATIQQYFGYYHLVRGNPYKAEKIFVEVLEICDHFEIENLRRSVSSMLAMVESRTDRWEAAIARLEPLKDPKDFLKGGTYIWHWLYLAIAESLLASGLPNEALVEVEQSIDLTTRAGERPHIAHGVKLKGDILLGLGEMDQARECYLFARHEAEACGMQPLIAECQRSRASLLAHSGDVDMARNELQHAVEGYEAIGVLNLAADAQSELDRL